jgi:hypothetical protein
MAEQGMQERDNRLVLFVAKGTEAIRLADNMRQLGDERKRQVDDEFSRHLSVTSRVNATYAEQLRSLIRAYDQRLELLETVGESQDDEDE